jgi:hypothetical protein
MTEITITRALVELKTLDKRIEKQIESATFVSYEGQFHKPSPEVANAVSTFQSINDLIDRRKKIKSAIVMSNALTKINICSQEMTIAEAIETKSSIAHKKSLLNMLRNQYGTTVNTVEQINARVRKDLEQKSSMQPTEKDKQMVSLEDFSKSYISMHGVKLSDPLEVTKRCEQLEKYITQFEQEIDYLLSERNATTLIKV